MDEIIILGIASDAKKIGEQNSADIETLKAGMTYKGEVADYAHLPATDNEEGDIWKTLDTGNKYIWSNIQGTDQWSLWDEANGGVTSFGGETGAITVGSGLSMSGKQLSSTGISQTAADSRYLRPANGTADFQLDQTGEQIQKDLDLTENLQPTFSTSATYAVNDIVIYNSKLHKCHTAVTSAGAWDSTKWSEIHIDSLVSPMTDADIEAALGSEIITCSVTNGTYSGDSIITGTAEVTIVPSEGYVLPSSVTVVGATSSYDDSTGVISLSNATGEVSITAACVAVYSITASVTNGSYSGATQISTTASGTLSANQDYVLPSSITVTGATLDSYDSSTGAVSISAPTGNVTITCVCEASGGGLPTPKASLADYTLEEIQQLSEALVDNTISKSDLSSTYHISVGDTMPITAAINNETHSYRMTAVKHDLDINGDYAGMTFKQVDLMANTYAMKSSMSSTDSWQNSDLKTTLEGFTVNPALAAVIKPVKKVCAASVSSGTPTYNYVNTTNGLFIESETEVFGAQDYTIGGTVEGSRYEWYANGGSTIMQRNGSNAWWWLRSPYDWYGSGEGSVFADVSNSGSVDYSHSGDCDGVAPCFCI